MVIELNSIKRYKFSVKTLFIEDNVALKRTTQNNALYLYVYDGKTPLIGLKVTIREWKWKWDYQYYYTAKRKFSWNSRFHWKRVTTAQQIKMVDNLLCIRANGRSRFGGVHCLVKVKSNSKEDLGIRLLKILLLRFYHMYSEIPLKWYEMLITAILGVLLGLGVGIVVGNYIKPLVVRPWVQALVSYHKH